MLAYNLISIREADMGKTERIVLDERQASRVMEAAWAKFFRCLGDPTSLRIVELLLEREKT